MRLMLVQSYKGGNAAAKRHYPFWQKAGCDRIVGILTEGGGFEWPTTDCVEIGRDSYISGDHLCQRLLRTLEYGLSQGADEICVIEYDTVFFKPLPAVVPKGYVMNWIGGEQYARGYKCSRFAHNPWLMDAATAQRTVEVGKRLLEIGSIEGGSPDTFLGLVTDLAGIPVHDQLFRNYSRNSLDLPGHINEAREAYLAGATAIHGIKHKAELDYITAP